MNTCWNSSHLLWFVDFPENTPYHTLLPQTEAHWHCEKIWWKPSSFYPGLMSSWDLVRSWNGGMWLCPLAASLVLGTCQQQSWAFTHRTDVTLSISSGGRGRDVWFFSFDNDSFTVTPTNSGKGSSWDLVKRCMGFLSSPGQPLYVLVLSRRHRLFSPSKQLPFHLIPTLLTQSPDKETR